MTGPRCTNADRGTFNHECGKPATFVGTQPSGYFQFFCARCREHGDEAAPVTEWRPLTSELIAECEAANTAFLQAGTATQGASE